MGPNSTEVEDRRPEAMEWEVRRLEVVRVEAMVAESVVRLHSVSYSAVLWWVDPGWMPGAHQSRSIAPLPQLDRGRK